MIEEQDVKRMRVRKKFTGEKVEKCSKDDEGKIERDDGWSE